MKRSTAVQTLRGLAAGATDGLRLREDFSWSLTQMWVAGEVLSPATTFEMFSVVLMLDIPADELPWMALHREGEWIGDRLRLTKRHHVTWWYRSAELPAWNYEHRRVARFWTDTDGPDDALLTALAERRFDQVGIVEPTPAELSTQLRRELAVSLRHLREITENYWEHSWRREHRSADHQPEDHLWRAACAVAEMEAALAALPASTNTDLRPA